jgi:enoyl-CoA hydratase
MTYQNILLEQAEAGIYVLTVSRPQSLNALNAAMLAELAHAIARVASDGAARALLITGAGEKAFVAGADIAEMRPFSAQQAFAFSEAGQRATRAIEELPVPAIALVNGYALGGGCELALACDWIIASDRAVFGQPEVNLGIPPGFGGTQRLARRLGRALAMELVTTGRQIKAEEALQCGLVSQIVAPAALMTAGLEQARLIASKAPFAVRACKQAVRRGLDMDLANACALETSLFALSFGSADRLEGMTAFIEKRPPQFKGE